MVRDEPLSFWKHIKSWNAAELTKIKEVKKVPNVIINNVGLFIDLNYHCIEPEGSLTNLIKLKKALQTQGFETNRLSYGILYR